MSTAYDNVVCGRLKLKGKALEVRDGGFKKKRKHKKHYQHLVPTDGMTMSTYSSEDMDESAKNSEKGQYNEYLTAAERRYIQQTERINLQQLEKMATKSHRDRVEEFNRYLANLSEHYDIPKVGPG